MARGDKHLDSDSQTEENMGQWMVSADPGALIYKGSLRMHYGEQEHLKDLMEEHPHRRKSRGSDLSQELAGHGAAGTFVSAQNMPHEQEFRML